MHWVLDVVFKEDQSRLGRGHGALNMAGPSALSNLDWPLFQLGSFQNITNDPTKSVRIAAELLCYADVPLQALDAILCWDDEALRQVCQEVDVGPDTRIIADSKCFFSKTT